MNPNRIGVLHFSNSTVRGGVEEHFLTLLDGLDRRYFRLHLVCTPENISKLRDDIPADVELIPLHLASPRDGWAAVQLARILRSRKIGILHSHMFSASLYASPIGWACRVPVIVETPHIRELWRKGWKASFWIDRLVGRCVTHYVCVSEANRDYLRECKRLPSRKMVVIRSASDVHRFDPARPVPLDLKRSLGFGDDDPVILVVARLEPQKGHAVLLQAMPAVLSHFPKARLVCVSDGQLRQQLEAQTRDLNIERSVRFVGYQADLADWYALADFTVLPSFFEGLPLAPIEALSAGRTVVATAVDGTPEVILDGQTGLTVPPGDVGKLADAICRLLAHPELRQHMAHAGRKLVLEQFSLERLIRETEQLYLRAWQEQGGAIPDVMATAAKV